jgi:hypothetical protein
LRSNGGAALRAVACAAAAVVETPKGLCPKNRAADHPEDGDLAEATDLSNLRWSAILASGGQLPAFRPLRSRRTWWFGSWFTCHDRRRDIFAPFDVY